MRHRWAGLKAHWLWVDGNLTAPFPVGVNHRHKSSCSPLRASSEAGGAETVHKRQKNTQKTTAGQQQQQQRDGSNTTTTVLQQKKSQKSQQKKTQEVNVTLVSIVATRVFLCVAVTMATSTASLLA